MKNILITFICYDQDSFKYKKSDSVFMYSHRQALFKYKQIKEDQLDQKRCSEKQLREGKPPPNLECLTKDDIWRPTVALAMGYEAIAGVQDALHFDEIYILHDKGNPIPNHDRVIDEVLEDVNRVKRRSCEIHTITKVFDNAWDHNEVYKYLYHLLRQKDFQSPDCQYYVNVTSGTNAIKNSLFILTQQRVINALRIMPHPWNNPRERNYRCANGGYQLDDPSAFDAILADIRKEEVKGSVKDINEDIETKDPAFRKTLEQIAKVSSITRHPILLTGPTGSGKTQIAKNIFNLLKTARKLEGLLQHINCATLAGDPNISYSTLFGHVKGSYTGAEKDEPGALKLADKGVLFLDEIGTLGLKEQSMLLTAIEKKEFRPLGATKDVKSDFRLICGTNENLWKAVEDGRFRRDLLERINLWHFELPGLSERKGEIMHQCRMFLDNRKVKFASQQVLSAFQSFIEEEYSWPGNFREMNAILERMCDMSIANSITQEVVDDEIERTRRLRQRASESIAQTDTPQNPSLAEDKTSVANEPAAAETAETKLREIIGDDVFSTLTPLERVQLAYVSDVCKHYPTLEELGKHLYGSKAHEDGNRSTLSRFLNKYGLSFRKGALKRRPSAK